MIAIALLFRDRSEKLSSDSSKAMPQMYKTDNEKNILYAPSLHLSLFAGIDDSNLKNLKASLDKLCAKAIRIEYTGIGIFLKRKVTLYFRWKTDRTLMDFRNKLEKVFKRYLPKRQVPGYGNHDWIAKTTWLTIFNVDSDISKLINDCNSLVLKKYHHCSELILIKYSKDGKEEVIYSRKLDG